MRIFGMTIGRARAIAPEARSSTGATARPADNDFLRLMGLDSMTSASSIVVNIDNALSVPAVFAAVNFIPGTLAGLPLNLYRRTAGSGRDRVTDVPLARILHDAPNDEQSSFEWRKYLFERVMTGGRGLSFIERKPGGEVTNIWPLDPRKVKIRRTAQGAKVYEYKAGNGAVPVVYAAKEVIDIPFMLREDGLSHYGPIAANRDVIGLAIAATQFGSRFFQNGGVPPFAVTGNFQSGRALAAASNDLEDAVRKSAREGRMAITLPSGLEIKALGADAQKSQLIELKQFLIQEIARIYSLPPTFLQDLSDGTFSNTEQQDLHFVKHTMKRWVEAFEQELNLKLFGRGEPEFFVEMNMDGLLRGDFKTRMEGYATGIQNAIIIPNEARRRENLPDAPDGDRLMIQGATVPIGTQPVAAPDQGSAGQGNAGLGAGDGA
jgi:HK97 family phage portal protein